MPTLGDEAPRPMGTHELDVKLREWAEDSKESNIPMVVAIRDFKKATANLINSIRTDDGEGMTYAFALGVIQSALDELPVPPPVWMMTIPDGIDDPTEVTRT